MKDIHTIWHNPACGTSRNVLGLIRASGVEPTVVDYVKQGWSRQTLIRLAAETGKGIRGLMREKGTPAAELGLLDPDLCETIIFEAMLVHPILVNRPIVQTHRGVALCRPCEKVMALLDNPPESFIKEDGTLATFPDRANKSQA